MINSISRDVKADTLTTEDEDESDEDDLAEIDPSNIIESGRTRGRRIDFTEEAAKLPAVCSHTSVPVRGFD